MLRMTNRLYSSMLLRMVMDVHGGSTGVAVYTPLPTEWPLRRIIICPDWTCTDVMLMRRSPKRLTESMSRTRATPRRRETRRESKSTAAVAAEMQWSSCKVTPIKGGSVRKWHFMHLADSAAKESSARE